MPSSFPILCWLLLLAQDLALPDPTRVHTVAFAKHLPIVGLVCMSFCCVCPKILVNAGDHHLSPCNYDDDTLACIINPRVASNRKLLRDLRLVYCRVRQIPMPSQWQGAFPFQSRARQLRYSFVGRKYFVGAKAVASGSELVGCGCCCSRAAQILVYF